MVPWLPTWLVAATCQAGVIFETHRWCCFLSFDELPRARYLPAHRNRDCSTVDRRAAVEVRTLNDERRLAER